MIDRCLFTPNGDDPPCAVPLTDLCTVPTPEMAYLLADLVIGGRAGSQLDLLEIGTGSGYEAAILAEQCRSLVSIEVNMLPETAAKLLENVALIHANGYEFDTQGEFDGVLVTFGSRSISPVSAKQVKDGGRLVVPLVNGEVSQIRVYERRGDVLHLLEIVGYAEFTEGVLA